MRSGTTLATAGSASRWHRRTYVLLPVTGSDLAHGLRVRRFAWGNGWRATPAERLIPNRTPTAGKIGPVSKKNIFPIGPSESLPYPITSVA